MGRRIWLGFFAISLALGGSALAGCRDAIGLDGLIFDNGFDKGMGGGGGSLSGAGGGGGGTGGSTFPANCGDGKQDFFPVELCDDGNNLDGDRCSSDCRCGVPDELTDTTAMAFHGGSGSCYVYMGDMTVMPEADAQDLCNLAQGGLFSLESAAELQFIVNVVGGSSSIWIGGKRLTSNPLYWRWLSGEPWLIYPCNPADSVSCDDKIQLWGSGEPNNTGGNEDCIQTLPNVAAMRDVPCTDPGRVVCRAGLLFGKTPQP